MARLKKKELMGCYYEKLLLFGAMDYYNLKEDELEAPAMEVIERAAAALLEDGSKDGLEEELAFWRKELREQMDVLSAYVDRLEVYQYVLNRVELRFDEQLEELDEAVFVQKVMQHIFSTKDNVAINGLIKEVIGQLPVRMTKGKYFERLKNSLSIYKGADKSSLDSMLYVLRTAALLYHPAKEGQCYQEYGEMEEKLRKADFSNITKEEHQELERLLEEAGDGLLEEMDACTLLAEAVNHFYGAYLLAEELGAEGKPAPEVQGLFAAAKAGCMAEAEQELERLEGRQERLLNREMTLEKGLFEADPKDPSVQTLLMAQAFGTNNLFMEFDFEKEESMVDAQMLAEEIKKLTEELKELFAGNSRLINRAIMANTLSKLPVFFDSFKEVMEYLKNALAQCHDLAEKNMSMNLIYHIIEGTME